MEGFLGLQKSKISSGITSMIYAMHALGVQYLDNSYFFTTACHMMPREFNKNADWLTLFGDSFTKLFAKHAFQTCFKS